jgi:molybdopterin/thiamine biosynthesis adenylyltransferase
VKSVTIFDEHPVEISDLSSQVNPKNILDNNLKFYFSEKDVGKKRAPACIEKLAQLNPSVAVSAVTGKLHDELSKFQVCVRNQS